MRWRPRDGKWWHARRALSPSPRRVTQTNEFRFTSVGHHGSARTRAHGPSDSGTRILSRDRQARESRRANKPHVEASRSQTPVVPVDRRPRVNAALHEQDPHRAARRHQRASELQPPGRTQARETRRHPRRAVPPGPAARRSIATSGRPVGSEHGAEEAGTLAARLDERHAQFACRNARPRPRAGACTHVDQTRARRDVRRKDEGIGQHQIDGSGRTGASIDRAFHS
jgi:hypothetical protein